MTTDAPTSAATDAPPAARGAAAAAVPVDHAVGLAMQLASVRRTLEWALLDEPRLQAAPYLGAGCAARVRQLLPALPEKHHPALLNLVDLLLSIDHAKELPGRIARAQASVALLGALVPAELAGLMLPLAQPLGRFIDPRRRRRADRKKGEKSGPGSSGQGSAAKGASTLGASESEPEPRGSESQPGAQAAAPSEGARADDAGAQPEERVVSEEQVPAIIRKALAEAERARQDTARPAPAPTRRRLLFGHPDGTGAPLSTVADNALCEALAQHGIEAIADLLLLPPKRFSRPKRLPTGDLPEEPVLVRGTVLWRRILLSPGGRRLEVALSLRDGRRVDCRWLSAPPRGWDTWSQGADLALAGEVIDGDDTLVLYEAEPVGLDGRGSGLMPVYDVDGVDEIALRDLVARQLSAHLGGIEDWMPSQIRDEHKLMPLDEALRDAHFPANADGRGRTRLTFDELLLIQLGIGWRAGRGTTGRGVVHKALHSAVGQLTSEHNIILSDGQERAFADIRRDLLRNSPMTRLLQGDVGAGKNMVSLMAGLVVAANSHQVAFLSPDKLAAERRFLHAESMLRSLAVVPLLVGDTIDRASADAISRGEAHIVFGTRALLSEELKWRRLGLLVVEERAPYGTVTRADLGHLGHQPDLLVVTRTPIPSSLVFAAFGAFDVSVVQAEHGLNVITHLHEASARSEVYAAAREAVAQGRQVLVAFPVREGRDLLGRRDAMRMAKALQSDAFPGARIGVYSSEMSRDERSRVFEDFQHRRIDVLVCTTYIEDAPVVSNATVMVVEYADLHDTIRLHRLRGHVGQGWTRGQCHFILSDDPDQTDRGRVETTVGVVDGFKLAEHDLEWRGSNALLGDRAKDLPNLRWSEPARDRAVLLQARDAAFSLLHDDPGLRRSKALARAVHQRWGAWLDQVLPIPDQKRLGAPESKSRRRRRRRRKR